MQSNTPNGWRIANYGWIESRRNESYDFSMNTSNQPFRDSATTQAGEPNPQTSPVAASGKIRASTKTFAIVLLVLGLLGVFSAIAAPIMVFVVRSISQAAGNADGGNSELKMAEAQIEQLMSPWSIASLLASLLTGLCLILGGIGTLIRKGWAVRLLRWSAAIMVPLSLAQTGLGMYMQASNKDRITQQVEEQLTRQGQGQTPEGLESVGQVVFVVQVAFTACIGCVFAAVYLWAFLHLSKSTTLEQFATARSLASAPTNS